MVLSYVNKVKLGAYATGALGSGARLRPVGLRSQWWEDLLPGTQASATFKLPQFTFPRFPIYRPSRKERTSRFVSRTVTTAPHLTDVEVIWTPVPESLLAVFFISTMGSIYSFRFSHYSHGGLYKKYTRMLNYFWVIRIIYYKNILAKGRKKHSWYILCLVKTKLL